MIVVDASAVLAALLNDGTARRLLGDDTLHAPHLVDSEVANGLRRRVRAAQMGAADGWRALDTWRHLAVNRYPVHAMLDRIWELRDNVSAYDATYVALAELLDCALVTSDTRLIKAVGIRCPVTVIPR